MGWTDSKVLNERNEKYEKRSFKLDSKSDSKSDSDSSQTTP